MIPIWGCTAGCAAANISRKYYYWKMHSWKYFFGIDMIPMYGIISILIYGVYTLQIYIQYCSAQYWMILRAVFMFRMQRVNKRSEIENILVQSLLRGCHLFWNYIRYTICITMLHQNKMFFDFLIENWKNVLIERTCHFFWNYIRYTICITMLHLKWNVFDFLLSS